MSEMEAQFKEVQILSLLYQRDIATGKHKWEDEEIQFVLPVVLYLTDWEWLKIAAENMLVEEDEKIVKNFLTQLESLVQINEKGLNKAVEDKIGRLFDGK